MKPQPQNLPTYSSDVLVIGSGLAGIACALALAPLSVTLLTKTSRLASGSSVCAKGGIAAAIAANDTPELHAVDTLTVGGGLSNPERTRALTAEGAENLRWLMQQGVSFDRDPAGELSLAQEAAHRFPRIVHAGGDGTGQLLMRSLAKRAQATSTIDVRTNTTAIDLIIDGDRVCGVYVADTSGQVSRVLAPNVVLATGGIGMAWWQTTNPREATGDGLAMAARAGARLTDLEFVQFHPTALAPEGNFAGASMQLLTEALRGAGALLVDETGERFMQYEHPAAEMAPRDIVARTIAQRQHKHLKTFLDVRPIFAAGRQAAFPQAIAASEAAGYDPATDLLPVAPAAHYHMGGVQTDSVGRTSVAGLYACGEVATTGIHGANRLASNSLLEALAFARRVAKQIAQYPVDHDSRGTGTSELAEFAVVAQTPDLVKIIRATRQIMSRQVGVQRTAMGLESALNEFSRLDAKMAAIARPTDRGAAHIATWNEARNTLLVARLIALAASQREESRGAHYRGDFPTVNSAWRRRQTFTIGELTDASAGS